MTVQLLITHGGLDALVNAEDGNTQAIKIVSVGLTDLAFTMAPTIDALPGEFKRLTSVSGQATSPTMIHMTAQDVSTDIYELRGIGLYLEDGTLFAVYSQAEPIFRKVSIAAFLLALDVAFANGESSEIVFGDATFLMPPASETVKGVAEIATGAEALSGADHTRIITPLTLKLIRDAARAETDADLTALSEGFDAILAALIARTITGAGLVSGGGDLSASRVLTVLAASAADVAAGSAVDRAVTPGALSGLPHYLGQEGYAVLPGCGGLIMQWGRLVAAPNATTSTVFPIAFPTVCLAVVPAGGHGSGVDSQDNPPVLSEPTITTNGFSVFSADDTSAAMRWIALGV